MSLLAGHAASAAESGAPGMLIGSESIREEPNHCGDYARRAVTASLPSHAWHEQAIGMDSCMPAVVFSVSPEPEVLLWRVGAGYVAS